MATSRKSKNFQFQNGMVKEPFSQLLLDGTTTCFELPDRSDIMRSCLVLGRFLCCAPVVGALAATEATMRKILIVLSLNNTIIVNCQSFAHPRLNK